MHIEPAKLFRPIQVSKQEIYDAEAMLKKDPMQRFAVEVNKHLGVAGKKVTLREMALKKVTERHRDNGWHFEHQGWLMGSFSTWPTEQETNTSYASTEGFPLRAPRSLASLVSSNSSFLVSPDGVCHAFTPDEIKALFKGVAPNGPDLAARLVAKGLERVAERGESAQFLPLEKIEHSEWGLMEMGRHSVKKDLKPTSPWSSVQTESTRRAFEAAVGPARAEMLAMEATSTAVTNWLLQGDRFRRRQALDLLPGVLIPLIEEQKTHADVLKVGRLVDEGQPWYEALAQALEQHVIQVDGTAPEGFRATVVRGLHRLSKLSEEAKPRARHLATSGWANSLHEMLHGTLSKNELRLGGMIWMCGQIETVDFPKRPGQFSMMFHTLQTLFPAELGGGKFIDWERVSRYRPLLKGVATSVGDDEKGWLVPDDTVSRFTMFKRDVNRWLADAFAGHDQDHRNAISQRLENTWTPKQWFDASDAFHRFYSQSTLRESARQAERFRELDQGRIGPMWSVGGPESFEHQGVSFRPLRHPLELLREGDEMSHCVAGYAPQCLRGHSRIFALMDANTGERATLEVRQFIQVSGEFAYEQEQLFAQGNENPSSAIHAAAQQFMDLLKKDFTAQQWPEMEVPADLECSNTGPDAVFFEQLRAWTRARHRNLYDGLQQAPASQPEAPVVLPADQTLGERLQQRRGERVMWNVVPAAMPGLGL